ncbi:MAG: HD-GYP domain-containing protein [Acidobacteriota bacterium]
MKSCRAGVMDFRELAERHSLRLRQQSRDRQRFAGKKVCHSGTAGSDMRAALPYFAKILDERTHEFRDHSLRVQTYAVHLARQLNFTQAKLEDLALGAFLHDIGKIGVSASILFKPGPLTLEEQREMMQHPEIGYKMLRGLKFAERAAEMILYHHENYDGSGYPDGLSGTQIPLAARIVALSDSYDAMTSHRPYRDKRTPRQARQQIQEMSGSQFDPCLVEAFLKIPAEQWERIGRTSSTRLEAQNTQFSYLFAS